MVRMRVTPAAERGATNSRRKHCRIDELMDCIALATHTRLPSGVTLASLLSNHATKRGLHRPGEWKSCPGAAELTSRCRARSESMNRALRTAAGRRAFLPAWNHQHRDGKPMQHRRDGFSQRQVGQEAVAVCAKHQQVQSLLRG